MNPNHCRTFNRMKAGWKWVAATVALCCLLAMPVAGAAGPLEQAGGVSADQVAKDSSPGGALAGVLKPVQWFRTYLSGVDGDRCPMYPSCSRYALESFERHGVIMGWFMTCDRLMRCGRDETRLSPPVYVNGRLRCYDPVDRNDFWWK